MKGHHRSLGTALAVLLLFAPGAIPTQAAGTAFVSELNDVPLMPELRALGDTLIFDKPGGRIAEAVFTGRASAAAIREFYAQTLPQLGWREERAAGERTGDRAGDRYVRENEELILRLGDGGGGNGSTTTLRLVLRPRR